MVRYSFKVILRWVISDVEGIIEEELREIGKVDESVLMM